MDKHAFDAAVKNGADDAVKRALDAAAKGAADDAVKAAAGMRSMVGAEVKRARSWFVVSGLRP
jgi:hypothetical protein